MNDTPEDPRLPEPGGGEDDTNPIEPAAELPAELPAEPPHESVELPPLAPLGDLPPLDGDGDPPKRHIVTRGRLAVVAVAALMLLGGTAFAVTSGGDDTDDDDGGIASVDDSESDDDDSDGSSGSGDRPSQEEMQDAMLEFAQCMRDHGVDMPDPEFDEGGGGGMRIGGGGPDGAGPNQDEWEAADEACSSIMDDIRGQRTPPSPEELAEMQDKLLVMAQCMRDRGYDMPDPQISTEGGIEISIGAEEGGTGGPRPDQDEEWMKDQEECSEEAGMEGPEGARPGMVGGG